MQEAKGDLIAFLDDDDIWTNEQKLSMQVDYFLAHPKLALLGTDVQVINEK